MGELIGEQHIRPRLPKEKNEVSGSYLRENSKFTVWEDNKLKDHLPGTSLGKVDGKLTTVQHEVDTLLLDNSITVEFSVWIEEKRKRDKEVAM